MMQSSINAFSRFVREYELRETNPFLLFTEGGVGLVKLCINNNREKKDNLAIPFEPDIDIGIEPIITE